MVILKNIINNFPDQPEKTSITITNAPKSVLKNSTNILPKYKDYTIQWLLDSNTI